MALSSTLSDCVRLFGLQHTDPSTRTRAQTTDVTITACAHKIQRASPCTTEKSGFAKNSKDRARLVFLFGPHVCTARTPHTHTHPPPPPTHTPPHTSIGQESHSSFQHQSNAGLQAFSCILQFRTTNGWRKNCWFRGGSGRSHLNKQEAKQRPLSVTRPAGLKHSQNSQSLRMRCTNVLRHTHTRAQHSASNHNEVSFGRGQLIWRTTPSFCQRSPFSLAAPRRGFAGNRGDGLRQKDLRKATEARRADEVKASCSEGWRSRARGMAPSNRRSTQQRARGARTANSLRM